MGKNGFKVWKIGLFQFLLLGISAKLNDLESESDTSAQNGLENQFPFSITTSALCSGSISFCIVQGIPRDGDTDISSTLDISSPRHLLASILASQKGKHMS